jgi:hypothetical protein
VGTLNIDRGDWSCTSTVTNKSGETGVKIIDMQLTDESGVSINISKELNSNTNPFELSNI